MSRNSPSLIAATACLTLALAVPAMGQNDLHAPQTAEECRSYANQQANEEYLTQRTTIRETSPFARSPSGRPDPLQQSANQQADIDRSGREQQLYNDCIAKLPK